MSDPFDQSTWPKDCVELNARIEAVSKDAPNIWDIGAQAVRDARAKGSVRRRFDFFSFDARPLFAGKSIFPSHGPAEEGSEWIDFESPEVCVFLRCPKSHKKHQAFQNSCICRLFFCFFQ